MNKRILIAGHGYLGAPLARKLAGSGSQLLAISKSVDDSEPDREYPLTACNLGDPNALIALTFEPDLIVHCASSNRGGPDAYRSVFEQGIQNLCEAFPHAHIFLTSSTSVYGQTNGSTVTENSPAEPDRETSRILRTAENSLIAHGGTVLRLAGIYGPGRSVHLRKFLAGEARIESGEVSRYLNQIHRDDIVSAISHLIRCDKSSTHGQIFNVSDETPITQRECYEALAQIFDKPVPPEAEPDKNRKRAWTNKRISIEKLQSTGWEPRFRSFTDAVKNDPELIPSIQRQLDTQPGNPHSA